MRGSDIIATCWSCDVVSRQHPVIPWNDHGTALTRIRAQWTGVARLTAGTTYTCQVRTAAVNVHIITTCLLVSIYGCIAKQTNTTRTIIAIIIIAYANLIATTTTISLFARYVTNTGIDISCWIVEIVSVRYPRSTSVQRIAGGAKTIGTVKWKCWYSARSNTAATIISGCIRASES